jgi:hypothetical protein
MRVRGWLLVGSGLAAVVAVAGNLFRSGELELQGGLAVYLALGAFTALSPAPRAVRLTLLGALAALAVRAAVDLATYEPPPSASQLLDTMPPPPTDLSVGNLLAEGLRGGWPALLAYTLVLVAVIGLPARQGVTALVIASTAVLVVAAYAVERLARDVEGLAVLSALAYLRAPLLILLLAGLAVILAARRAWLVALGVGLLTVPTIIVYGPAGLAHVTRPVLPEPPNALIYGYAIYDPAPGTWTVETWVSALAAAGLLFVVIGCLRRRVDSGAVPD